MKTKKIKFSPEFNFKLIGITSTAEDYKISWILSKILKTDFIKLPDIQIIDDKFSEYQYFSVFESRDADEEISFKIISNKANVGYLAEDLHQIDYFLIVYKNIEYSDLEKIKKEIKQNDAITSVFIFDINDIKSKEKFIF